MGSSTQNLELYKPDRTDYVSVVTDINLNMEKIDNFAGGVNGKFDNDALKPDNGGTGATDAQSGLNNLINSLYVGGSPPTDDDYMIAQYASGGEIHKVYNRRKFSLVFDYILGKIAKSGEFSSNIAYLRGVLSNQNYVWIVFGAPLGNQVGFVGVLIYASNSWKTLVLGDYRSSGTGPLTLTQINTGNDVNYKLSDGNSTYDCTRVFAIRVQ